MSIRVLHILSGDLWGGAEAQMGLQMKAQRGLNVDSRALLLNEGETRKKYTEFDIPLEVIPESMGLLKLIIAAQKSVRELKPNLIVSHGYKETFIASYISIFDKIPFISTIHGGTESYSGLKAFKSFFYTALSNFLSRNLAKSTIVPTLELQSQLNLKGQIIGNVADIRTSNVNLEPLRKSLGFDVSEPLVVWVGRIVPVKRLDRALKAFEILKTRGVKVNLAVVGIGELKEQLERMVEELKLKDRVKFLGFRSDAGEIISCSEILLLTSESEGLPTVMAEAMTRGIKLVISDLPGIRGIAKKFQSYPIELIASQTPEAFASGIQKSLSAPVPVPDDVNASRNWFDPNRAAKEALSLFQTIVN